MPKPWSKRCLFIFFKVLANLVPRSHSAVGDLGTRLGSSCSATYFLINFVNITSFFASLAAAGDDKHSNCENSTMSNELNSTENSQVFSVFDVFGLSSLMFDGLFAGCYNSRLVALDQCWETRGVVALKRNYHR